MKTIWRRQRLQLLDRSMAIYKSSEAVSGATNIANYDRHLDSSFLADHIRRPEIVDRLTSVLGPNVLCWRTEFFPKYPGDEGTDFQRFLEFSGKRLTLKPPVTRDARGEPVQESLIWERLSD